MITDKDTGKLKRSYRKWSSMIRRCSDPKHPAWKYYAGRSITVCSQWQGRSGYAQFIADMGEPPDGLTLGRIDNDKGYSPDNCRWETWKQQGANRRPRVRNPNSLAARADAAGIPHWRVYQRIRDGGWYPEDAVTIPVGQYPDRIVGMA